MKQNKDQHKKRFLHILIAVLIVGLAGTWLIYTHNTRSRRITSGESQNISIENGRINKKDNEKKITEATDSNPSEQETIPTESETTEMTETVEMAETTAEVTEAVEDTFEDALFIGDSRTEGFVLLSGIHAQYYACKGLNVASVYTDPVIAKDGTNMTVMEAVAGTEFKRVYLMFGVNETGWVNADIFIDDYKKILEDIRAAHPDAEIYVQSVLPVSQTVSDTHSYVKNDKIRQYNELLQKMTEEEHVTYVNVAEAVSIDGVLPDDAALDGIHLNQEYCRKWLAYLVEHTGK